MSASSPPSPVLVQDEAADRVLGAPPPPRTLGWTGGFLLRLLTALPIGALLCFNALTSVLVVGWTYRLTQRAIWRGWFQRSRFAGQESFESFAARHALPSPTPALPRWLIQEHARAAIGRSGRDGLPPGAFRRIGRTLKAAVGSLWANLGAGVQVVFCTAVLTWPACYILKVSWDFGWLVSFFKDYEEFGIGPLTGIFGIVLFIAAMIYVPMAQAHQAACADWRAFFAFRFVWRLIRQQLPLYIIFAALFSLATLPITGLEAAPQFFGQAPRFANASDAELLELLNRYFLGACFYVFPAFVFLRWMAASLYRRAVLGAIEREIRERGELAADRLPPALARWIDALELYPKPGRRPHFVVRVIVGTGRRVRNGFLYAGLVFLWFTVAAQVYIATFLNFRPTVGWMNQPLIHLPCLTEIPSELKERVKAEKGGMHRKLSEKAKIR